MWKALQLKSNLLDQTYSHAKESAADWANSARIIEQGKKMEKEKTLNAVGIVS